MSTALPAKQTVPEGAGVADKPDVYFLDEVEKVPV
jgi:hypothetical protein